MDKPKDELDDIQLVPVTVDDTEQLSLSNEALDSTAPLMADDKHVLFRESIEIIEDREFVKEDICEMITSESNKFIPLLRTTNLPSYK